MPVFQVPAPTASRADQSLDVVHALLFVAPLVVLAVGVIAVVIAAGRRHWVDRAWHRAVEHRRGALAGVDRSASPTAIAPPVPSATVAMGTSVGPPVPVPAPVIDGDASAGVPDPSAAAVGLEPPTTCASDAGAMVIGRVAPEDAHFVAALHDRLRQERPSTTTALPQVWDDNSGAAWLATVDRRCVGFVVVVGCPGDAVPVSRWVEPAHRGRGIGMALLTEAASWAGRPPPVPVRRRAAGVAHASAVGATR